MRIFTIIFESDTIETKVLISNKIQYYKMVLKSVLIISLLLVCSWLWSCSRPNEKNTTVVIDSAWWNGLSDEWKSILVINQNFSKQGVDIFKIQSEYINRQNKENEFTDEGNTSLYELNKLNLFNIGCDYLYRRALRTGWMKECLPIDLNTLGDLDTIYMVNGPGELTPLKAFKHLKVLILNYCGIDNSISYKDQNLDLSPLSSMKELKVLHCCSDALKTLDPIKDLTGLEKLRFDVSSMKSISSLKKLKNLKYLSFGLGIEKGDVVSKLVNLEELYIDGCKQLPDLSRLAKLKKLCVSEGEMVVVNSSYRINKLSFLENLTQLEYLDINRTSYSGSSKEFEQLSKLKAVTFPSSMYNDDVHDFIKRNKAIKVLNAYEFEY